MTSNRPGCGSPVGVFDSGVGGLSVVAEMLRILPGERFIYFGDSANAPYGTKPVDEIRRLSFDVADRLVGMGAKALVVACNTATSAAIKDLRARYSERGPLGIPVVGMEPAVKPAVELGRPGSVVVMATPLTLKEEKFRLLRERFVGKAEIIPLACPGLVELIEEGYLSGPRIENYLRTLFYDIGTESIGAIVLGCTHYVFVRGEIRKFVGLEVPVVDGNRGTARQLRRVLEDARMLAAESRPDVAQSPLSRVELLSSSDDDRIVGLSRRLLLTMLDELDRDQASDR